MKTTSFRFILAALATTAALVGCTKEITPNFENDKVNTEGSRIIAVSFAPQTKTYLGNDGFQPKFNDEDSILISNGEAIDTCAVDVNGDKATISTNLTGPLTAVYPYTAAGLNGNNSTQIDTVLVSTVQSGKFADANICMAKMKDGKDESLSFENKTAVFCIYPPTDNPEYVEVSADGFEIANDVPTGSTHTSLETIHVTTTSADSVWVSILVPDGLKVSDLTFSDGTNEKSVTTGAPANKEIAAGTLYTVTNENWKSPEADTPEGALKGVFTVSDGGTPTDTTDDIKVRFSQGNLYCKRSSSASNDWTWHFYSQQYEFLAADMAVIGSEEYPQRTVLEDEMEIHLFTWGYDATNSVKPTGTDYVEGHTKDGETFNRDEDWGYVFGGESSVWRTLTTEEWQYLFSYDGSEWDNPSYDNAIRRGKYKYGVTVCSKPNCVVIAPDNWDISKNPLKETYTAEEWAAAEAAGLVCLPSAGCRLITGVEGSVIGVLDVGICNAYWSSSSCNSEEAYVVGFDCNGVNPHHSLNFCNGYNVRLVTDVSAAPPPTPEDGTRGKLNGYDYVVVDGIKWATQNLAITTSGKKAWKGGNTSSAVKVPGTNEDVIVGDYFQWAAYAGYCGDATADDKGLLIYDSFINTKCDGVTGSDNFDFKNADESNKYKFADQSSTGYIAISPYYDSPNYQYYTDNDQYSTLSREATYTGHNDDVANIILGDNWRMPTSAEFDALIKATYWAWDGTDCGYYVFKPGQGTNGNANEQGTIDTGTDDKSAALLFFPAAGQGDGMNLTDTGSAGIYWSSSLYTDDTDKAYGLGFVSDELFFSQLTDFRHIGYSVRPVAE